MEENIKNIYYWISFYVKTYMEKRNVKNIYLDYFLIMLGTTIAALGINQFLLPNNLVVGGLSGIAIIIEYISSIPIGVTNILFNLPLFAIAIKQQGFRFVGRTMFAVVYLSIALWYTGLIPPILKTTNLFLCAIYGAIALGAGLGLVLRASASTGGTDMVASILNYKFRSIPISTFLMAIDSSIILLGAMVFGVEKAMYALITVYICSHVVSNILDGMHFAKAALIISDNIEEVSVVLRDNINRGATYIKGRGMYTKKERDMIYMIVSKKEIFKLQQVVKSVDPNAFISISDVREVLGKGFKEN